MYLTSVAQTAPLAHDETLVMPPPVMTSTPRKKMVSPMDGDAVDILVVGSLVGADSETEDRKWL